MNFRAILYFTSLFIFPIGVLAFINILYSSYFDFFLNIKSYVITLFLSLIFGFLLFRIGKNSSKKINFFEQIFLIILAYIIVSLLISLPYYLNIYNISFIDSVFESFSGVTLTGFTTFINIKQFDPTLILWRSSSQWIGGLYFFIFLILIFSNKQLDFKLSNLTFLSDNISSSQSNTGNIILKLLLIYAFTTSIIFVFFIISDIRLFDALNLAMSIVSTGGFLPTSSLDQIIRNNTQEIFLIISMIIPFLNLFFFLNVLNKNNLLTKHKEDIYLLFFILIFSLILLFSIESLTMYQILISVVSSMSNSGLAITEVSKNITLYFLLLTTVGGSVISLTSGIKFLRFYILLKTTASEILKLVRPNNIAKKNILNSEKKINNLNINTSFLVFISFFLSLFLLSGILVFDNINFENSFKLSILTLTNTVNSDLFGIEKINFSNLLTSSKLSLIFFMIVGKIELLSIFLLFKKYLFRN